MQYCLSSEIYQSKFSTLLVIGGCDLVKWTAQSPVVDPSLMHFGRTAPANNIKKIIEPSDLFCIRSLELFHLFCSFLSVVALVALAPFLGAGLMGRG
jgi:hypothetical protein